MDSAIQTYQNASQEQLREQLIFDNIDYVRKILSTLTVNLPPSYDKENLEQAGIVALVETANSFDPSRGVSFRTYCFPRIRGAIIDEMRKNSPVPQKMIDCIKQVKSAYERLEPPVTPEALADATGMGIDTIVQVLEAMRFSQPQHWDDLYCTIHKGWRNGEDQPDNRLEKSELASLIADCIERLPDRERLVLTLYFTEELTLSEIGTVIGVSESRVSRILAAAKFRLKELVLASM
ncbi:MAG: sigma-70 family RNA polymerase sigma factor [Planctomycetota bacterium]